MVIDRWNKILSILNERREISIANLAVEADVSISTIRRDINQLAARNLLICKNGIVSADKIMNRMGPEYVPSDIIYMRETKNISKKDMISRYAASLVKEEDIIFIDAGTTVNRMIPYLTAQNILIVTNSISAIPVILSAGFKAYICSGYITNGSDAIQDSFGTALKDINISKAFIGASGINKNGFFSTSKDYLLKRGLISNANEIYILCDSSKYERSAFSKFASPEDAVLITDAAPPFENDFRYIIAEYPECTKNKLF